MCFVRPCPSLPAPAPTGPGVRSTRDVGIAPGRPVKPRRGEDGPKGARPWRRSEVDGAGQRNGPAPPPRSARPFRPRIVAGGRGRVHAYSGPSSPLRREGAREGPGGPRRGVIRAAGPANILPPGRSCPHSEGQEARATSTRLWMASRALSLSKSSEIPAPGPDSATPLTCPLKIPSSAPVTAGSRTPPESPSLSSERVPATGRSSGRPGGGQRRLGAHPLRARLQVAHGGAQGRAHLVGHDRGHVSPAPAGAGPLRGPPLGQRGSPPSGSRPRPPRARAARPPSAPRHAGACRRPRRRSQAPSRLLQATSLEVRR